jgi:transcriptional regulator with XRE-family HTH domain
MTTAKQVFSRNIKEFRERQGLTQAELAEAADVSLGAVQGWEARRRWIEGDYIAPLARALGVPESALFADPDAPKSEAEESLLALRSALLALASLDNAQMPHAAALLQNLLAVSRRRVSSGRVKDSEPGGKVG